MYEAIHFEGNPQECGHVVTTACVRGGVRHVLRYAAERVVGNGSFGVVFQATCVETRETVAIKRVLQDKRFKNRELQIMKLLKHPNVVALRAHFYNNTDKVKEDGRTEEETYLNLVLEFVPDTVYRIIKHYAKRAQVRTPPAFLFACGHAGAAARTLQYGSAGVRASSACVELAGLSGEQEP